MPIKVALNGFGTIGKRIADSIPLLNGFKLIGVVKYRPDYSAYLAAGKGLPIYVPREHMEEFRRAGIEPQGDVDYLLEEADIIYDASPGGKGALNRKIYEKYGKPAVFQGGEKPEVAELSYSTLCNFKEALYKRYVRVVSCNTTGMLRLLCLLDKEYGVRKATVVIVRRAADPKEDQRGPVNSIQLDPPEVPSHHGLDAKSVTPKLNILTVAVVVPTTLMHMQFIDVELATSPGIDKVVDLLSRYSRFILVDSDRTGIDSTSKIMELSRDAGRKRGDIYENVIFSSTIHIDGSRLILFQGIHQESIVIPENLDVAHAMLGLEQDAYKVLQGVDKALGIGDLKKFISPTNNNYIGDA